MPCTLGPFLSSLGGDTLCTTNSGSAIRILDRTTCSIQHNQSRDASDGVLLTQVLNLFWISKRNRGPWHSSVIFIKTGGIVVTGNKNDFKCIFIFVFQLLVKFSKNWSKSSARWALNINNFNIKQHGLNFKINTQWAEKYNATLDLLARTSTVLFKPSLVNSCSPNASTAQFDIFIVELECFTCDWVPVFLRRGNLWK